MLPKYVCTSGNDDFFTESDSDAMDHLAANPDHELIVIERDPYTAEIVMRKIDTHEA